MGFSRGFREDILWVAIENARMGKVDFLAATTPRGTLVAILRNMLYDREKEERLRMYIETDLLKLAS